MARKQTFLAAEWSEKWKERYPELSSDRQSACDKAAIALIKRIDTPGLHVKPIHPDKFYSEARINSGDRIVFYIVEETIYFVDVVKHDDISRYGRKPGRSK